MKIHGGADEHWAWARIVQYGKYIGGPDFWKKGTNEEEINCAKDTRVGRDGAPTHLWMIQELEGRGE